MTFEQELMRTRSAYFLDGWLKFNEEMWGYKAERVMYTLPGKDKPALEGVLYLTKNGKVRQPPLNAYLPLPVAIVLILISVALTLFSGIIPSRSAAKKDPVVALRTE